MYKLIVTLLLGSSVFILQNCSWNGNKFQTFSHPGSLSGLSLNENFKKITFVASGDFRGNFFAEKEITGIRGLPPFEFLVGGVNIFAGYLDILKKNNKDGLVHLHLGGSFRSGSSKNDQTRANKVLEKLDIDAMLFSDKELLFRNNGDVNVLPFVNSNIVNLKTSSTVVDAEIAPWRIIEKNGIRIGLIGITPYESITDENKKQINGYYFEDPALAFIRAKNILEEEGVDLKILMMRSSSFCNIHFDPEVKKGNQPRNNQIGCVEDKGLLGLIRRLPPQTIDLIVASGKDPVYGYVGRIPVIQNPNDGKFFSKVEIYYDYKNKRIDPDLTRVYSPTKLCHNFLMATNDCHPYHKEEMLAKALASGESAKIHYVRASYLGEQVQSKEVLTDSN